MKTLSEIIKYYEIVDGEVNGVTFEQAIEQFLTATLEAKEKEHREEMAFSSQASRQLLEGHKRWLSTKERIIKAIEDEFGMEWDKVIRQNKALKEFHRKEQRETNEGVNSYLLALEESHRIEILDATRPTQTTEDVLAKFHKRFWTYCSSNDYNEIEAFLRDNLPVSEIDDKEIKKIIMFIRQNAFLPENDNIAKVKEMCARFAPRREVKWPEEREWFHPELSKPDEQERRVIQCGIDSANQMRALCIKAYEESQCQ